MPRFKDSVKSGSLRLESVPGKNPVLPKVVGSNPGTVCWMDIFHIFVVKIVMIFV